VINPSNGDFEPPLDQDAKGNVISSRTIEINIEDDTTQTPNKEDAKPEVNEEEPTPPLPESQDK
jgi:hypothetical protein